MCLLKEINGAFCGYNENFVNLKACATNKTKPPVKEALSRLSGSFYANYASLFIELEIYSETPPFGHLVIAAHFFWRGKTAIGFLTKNPR